MLMSASIKSADPDPVFILRSGVDSVTALKFCSFGSQSNEALVSGNIQGLVQIWDLKTKRIKLKFQASEGYGILQVDHIKVEQIDYLISHDRSGKVIFWLVDESDVIQKQILLVNDIGFCPIHILKLLCGDYWIAYPSATDSQFSVTQISFDDDKTVYRMKTEKNLGMVMHIKLFTKNETLYALAGYEEGSLYVWNVLQTSVVHSKRVHQEPVMCLAVDKNGGKVLSASADNIIRVLKLDKDVHLEEYTSQNTKTSGFSACCIRDDHRIVLCGGWDGKIRVFSWKSMKALAILKYHEESINAVCFNYENIIAVACKDGKISLWDVYS